MTTPMSLGDVAPCGQGLGVAYLAANKGAAWTRTYDTVATVLPAVTSAAVVTTGAAQPNTNFGFDSVAHANLLPVALNALQADSLALKKLLNAVIDDLQAFHLVTAASDSLFVVGDGVRATLASLRTAYTQTYATSIRTIPAATVVTPCAAGASIVGSTPSYGYTTAAQADALAVAINAQRVDDLILLTIAKALCADLQALGLMRPYSYVAGHLTGDRGELASLTQSVTLTLATAAAKTVPAATTAAVSTTGAATLAAGANWGFTTQAQADSFVAAIDALAADQLALKKIIVVLVQTLQRFGLAA